MTQAFPILPPPAIWHWRLRDSSIAAPFREPALRGYSEAQSQTNSFVMESCHEH
jgi:hypothetical protein